MCIRNHAFACNNASRPNHGMISCGDVAQCPDLWMTARRLSRTGESRSLPAARMTVVNRSRAGRLASCQLCRICAANPDRTHSCTVQSVQSAKYTVTITLSAGQLEPSGCANTSCVKVLGSFRMERHCRSLYRTYDSKEHACAWAPLHASGRTLGIEPRIQIDTVII